MCLRECRENTGTGQEYGNLHLVTTHYMREVIHNTVVEAKTSLEKGGWMREKVGIMH